MALMSGVKAHATSVAFTSFSTTGSPGGYYDVTDTINLGAVFNSIPSTGGYGDQIYANVFYYSGPYASGTLLQSGANVVYSNGGSLTLGTNNISANVNLNTPAILRASEPAGTQSILYVYSAVVGGGCMGWSGSATASDGKTYLVHG